MSENVGRSIASMSRRGFLKTSALFLAAGFLSSCTPQTGQPVNKAGDSPVPTLEPALVTEPPETRPGEVEVKILADDLDFPEGPAFDPDGNLWCTELNGGNLVRFKDGQLKRYAVQGRPNGLAFDRRGRAWVCDSGQNAIRRFDPVSESWETLLSEVDGQPLQTPNDLSFDQQGNLLFTCPNFASQDPNGYVCCLKPDGTALKIARGFYRPNGLDIIEDGQVLVVGDTYRKTLYKGAWDAASCTWSDPQPWIKVGGAEGPDGLLPGADGLLYVAVFGDGAVRVIGPEGKVEKSYALPGANPTNVACDPSGRLGLVVTEAEKGLLLSLPGVNPGPAILDGGDFWS
jgi:gluconolactonase